MGAMSRSKGRRGEQEIAAIIRDLTGWDIKRKVRQHGGDSDLEGVPGWCCEVKRHKSATRADIRQWWAQAIAQSVKDGPLQLPVLFYRRDRDDWRAVWPMYLEHCHYEWTVEASIDAWCDIARGLALKNRVSATAPMSYQD